VGPGASLDTVEKTKFLILLRLELRCLGQPRNERLWIARNYKKYCWELDDDDDDDDDTNTDDSSAVHMEAMDHTLFFIIGGVGLHMDGMDHTLS
jgi:hypothetical protein